MQADCAFNSTRIGVPVVSDPLSLWSARLAEWGSVMVVCRMLVQQGPPEGRIGSNQGRNSSLLVGHTL